MSEEKDSDQPWWLGLILMWPVIGLDGWALFKLWGWHPYDVVNMMKASAKRYDEEHISAAAYGEMVSRKGVSDE